MKKNLPPNLFGKRHRLISTIYFTYLWNLDLSILECVKFNVVLIFVIFWICGILDIYMFYCFSKEGLWAMWFLEMKLLTLKDFVSDIPFRSKTYVSIMNWTWTNYKKNKGSVCCRWKWETKCRAKLANKNIGRTSGWCLKHGNDVS